MGTLRVVEKVQGFKLGRLCVLKEYRGMHFGEELVRVRTRSLVRCWRVSLCCWLLAAARYCRPLWEIRYGRSVWVRCITNID